MHVLLIHQAFASLDEPGGTRHHELARYLVSRGQQVTVITSPVSYLTGSVLAGASDEQREPGIRLIRTHARRSLHASFVQRVLAFITFTADSFFIGMRVKNIDVVWGTSPPIFQGVSAWMVALLKRVPFLFEVRDLWPRFAVAVGVLKNPLLIKASLWLERFLYRRAKVVVVNSPGYIQHVRERGARRVEFVPNGADPKMFNPGDEGMEFRSANDLQGRFVVLYAGAHGISNDLGVVLDAARLLQEDPDAGNITIVLLGDGKEKAALQAHTVNMGLGNVLFLPPAPKTGMSSALAGADACIAILKPLEEYKTTYPNKVFDYMAAGRPVVLAIDGVIREVVEEAGCGIFTPPGDPHAMAEAIRCLAADPLHSRAMGLAGRDLLEQRFNRDQLAEHLLEILSSLVSGK